MAFPEDVGFDAHLIKLLAEWIFVHSRAQNVYSPLNVSAAGHQQFSGTDYGLKIELLELFSVGDCPLFVEVFRQKVITVES